MSEGEYTVRVIDMEPSIRGAVVLDSEGYPNIYINARLSREAQQEALRHELEHLEKDDHYNDKTIREIERSK